MESIIGQSPSPGASQALVEELSSLALKDALLYVGYPALSTADETVTIGGLLVSREHGLVVFDLPEGANVPSVATEEELLERQDAIVRGLRSKLITHKELCKRTELGFPIHAFTYGPSGFEL